jgi:PAS domain S-box-containing protein
MFTGALCLLTMLATAGFAWFAWVRPERARRHRIEQRLEIVDRSLATAGAGLFSAHPDQDQIVCSASTLQLRGLADTHEVGLREWMSVVYEPDRAKVRESVSRCLEHGRPSSIEYRILRPEGGYRWIRVTCEPDILQPRQAQIVYGLMLDVTPVKDLEAKVRARDERLRDASLAASFYTWQLDLQQMKFTVDWPRRHTADNELSDSIFETFESTPEQLLAIHHPDDRAALAAMIEKVRHEDVPYEIEGRVRGPNGEY